MKNGDLNASNLGPSPALELLYHRLKTQNPECSLTVYEIHEGHYRLQLMADKQSPFFKLDPLFESTF